MSTTQASRVQALGEYLEASVELLGGPAAQRMLAAIELLGSDPLGLQEFLTSADKPVEPATNGNGLVRTMAMAEAVAYQRARDEEGKPVQRPTAKQREDRSRGVHGKWTFKQPRPELLARAESVLADIIAWGPLTLSEIAATYGKKTDYTLAYLLHANKVTRKMERGQDSAGRFVNMYRYYAKGQSK